jgi:hypothetical protein
MVKDPFGHKWSISHVIATPSPEEVQERAKLAFAK